MFLGGWGHACDRVGCEGRGGREGVVGVKAMAHSDYIQLTLKFTTTAFLNLLYLSKY